jgi:hypothetical protein
LKKHHKIINHYAGETQQPFGSVLPNDVVATIRFHCAIFDFVAATVIMYQSVACVSSGTGCRSFNKDGSNDGPSQRFPFVAVQFVAPTMCAEENMFFPFGGGA